MADTMELRDILQIIWRRLLLIVLGTGLITAVVLVVSANLTPVYRAKVTMKVDQPATAPLAYSSIPTGENLALTYSRLLRTRPLLELVIANLGLDASPEELKESIGTNLVPDTPLVELTVEDVDARRAAAIANEIAFTFSALHNLEREMGSIAAFGEDMVAQMAELKSLIEHNQALIRESTPAPGAAPDSSLLQLQAALASQQSTYASLLSTYLEIQVTQSQFFNVDVVESAVPPTRPIRPRVPLYTFLGAFLGLSVSAGTAFLLEYLDRSLKTAEDVRRALERPTLGLIPRLQGTELHGALVAGSAPHSAVAEAFRALRTNLRFTGVDKPLTTILVSSAEPGAGKTTVAVNLGIVNAQAGFRVVVVDADLRLPRLHKAFGFANTTGLTDLLPGDAQDVKAYLRKTEIDNLSLLVAGPVPPNPSELLGSKRMADVLESLRDHADLVILDTPPVLPVTDAAVLAPKMDGVLLVARANQTQRDAIQHACENLLRVGGHVVGVVLNAVPTKPTSSYYPYYGARTGAIESWPAEEKVPTPVRAPSRRKTSSQRATQSRAASRRQVDVE